MHPTKPLVIPVFNNTLGTQAYKIYLKYGPPPYWPLSEVTLYAQKFHATTDLHYALYALLLLSMRPHLFGIFPVVVLAVYHFMAYASSRLKGQWMWEKYGK